MWEKKCLRARIFRPASAPSGSADGRRPLPTPVIPFTPQVRFMCLIHVRCDWRTRLVDEPEISMAIPPGQSNPSTAPVERPARATRHAAAIAAAPVVMGIATNYWLELLAYPPGSARSLWLEVAGAWRHLDNPSDGTQASVQAAFCNCPDRLEVAVWYQNDVIVGLVVRSK